MIDSACYYSSPFGNPEWVKNYRKLIHVIKYNDDNVFQELLESLKQMNKEQFLYHNHILDTYLQTYIENNRLTQYAKFYDQYLKLAEELHLEPRIAEERIQFEKNKKEAEERKEMSENGIELLSEEFYFDFLFLDEKFEYSSDIKKLKAYVKNYKPTIEPFLYFLESHQLRIDTNDLSSDWCINYFKNLGVKEIKASKFSLKKYYGYKLHKDVKNYWVEDFVCEDTGEIISHERSEVILSKGEMIDDKNIEKIIENGIRIIHVENPIMTDYRLKEYSTAPEEELFLRLKTKNKSLLELTISVLFVVRSKDFKNYILFELIKKRNSVFFFTLLELLETSDFFGHDCLDKKIGWNQMLILFYLNMLDVKPDVLESYLISFAEPLVNDTLNDTLDFSKTYYISFASKMNFFMALCWAYSKSANLQDLSFKSFTCKKFKFDLSMNSLIQNNASLSELDALLAKMEEDM